MTMNNHFNDNYHYFYGSLTIFIYNKNLWDTGPNNGMMVLEIGGLFGRVSL